MIALQNIPLSPEVVKAVHQEVQRGTLMSQSLYSGHIEEILQMCLDGTSKKEINDRVRIIADSIGGSNFGPVKVFILNQLQTFGRQGEYGEIFASQ